MNPVDFQPALRGLEAAARLERMPGISREQRQAAQRVVQRRMLDASDAGATGADLAAALNCTPAWASTRLARAREEHLEGLPDDLMPLPVVAARLGVSRDRVGAYRRAGRLPTRRVSGWEVADLADVVALEASLQDRGRGASAPGPERPDTTQVWLTTPRCARPAPPPWPVNRQCLADAGHNGEHDFGAGGWARSRLT